jgi:hypothetical protein
MDPRRRGRGKPWALSGSRRSTSAYLKVVVVVLACVLMGTLAWQGAERYLHPSSGGVLDAPVAPGRPYAAEGAPNDSAARGWQRDFATALDGAADSAKGGEITGAEIELDRGAAILGSAREKGFSATPEFFVTALRTLDGVAATHPESDRLGEHAFQTKIALAELRSAMNVRPAEAPSGTANDAVGAVDSHAAKISGHVVFDSPRAIKASQSVTSASLGGGYIDATVMPDTAEVLLPPSSRSVADNVRVTGLTIEGASQTIDGVSWKDITFIGTRLRYEGGPASLKNVKCVRCTFGFVDDEGGVKLIEAFARGETSVVVGQTVASGEGKKQ